MQVRRSSFSHLSFANKSAGNDEYNNLVKYISTYACNLTLTSAIYAAHICLLDIEMAVASPLYPWYDSNHLRLVCLVANPLCIGFWQGCRRVRKTTAQVDVLEKEGDRQRRRV